MAVAIKALRRCRDDNTSDGGKFASRHYDFLSSHVEVFPETVLIKRHFVREESFHIDYVD